MEGQTENDSPTFISSFPFSPCLSVIIECVYPSLQKWVLKKPQKEAIRKRYFFSTEILICHSSFISYMVFWPFPLVKFLFPSQKVFHILCLFYCLAFLWWNVSFSFVSSFYTKPSCLPSPAIPLREQKWTSVIWRVSLMAVINWEQRPSPLKYSVS